MTRWTPAALAVVGSLARTLPGADLDVRLLPEGLSDPGIVACAKRHKVLGAVSVAATETLGDTPERQRIAAAARQWYLAAMLTAHRTAEVFEALDEAGCRPVMLKGVVLSAVTTGTVTGRGPGDIDVLVDRRDMNRADTVLQSLGATTTMMVMPDLHAVTYRLGAHWVDLHHRVDRSPVIGISHGELWECSQVVMIADRQVRTLNLTDTAVFAAVSAGMDTWSQLVRVSDFIQLMASPELGGLEQRAREWRAEHLLDLAWAVCRRLDRSLPRGTAISEALAARAWLWIAQDRLLRLDQDPRARAERELYRLSATRDSRHARWWLSRNLRRPWSGVEGSFLTSGS